jgi:gamma-glutamylputrescine oxidase
MREIISRRRFLKYSAYAGASAVLGAAGLNQIAPMIWKEPLPLQPNTSYWATSKRPPNSPLTNDLDVDVAVVGGGLTGLASAYFVCRASPHKSVVVLEAQSCGSGASGRNGAMVLTMTGMDCELETNGALQVLGSSDDMKSARAYVQQARSLGMPVEYWESPRIVNAIGTEVYEGAFFDPNGGQIHPMKLIQALKATAETAGATVYENTLVQSIVEGREHLLYTSDGRTVKAKSLVLATNAFTPRLGFLQNAILPLHEYVAIANTFSEPELAQLGWRQRVPFNDNRTEVFYRGLTEDRRIHIGGGTPRYAYNNGPDNPDITRSHVSQLQRELIRLYPQLSGIQFAQTWSGVVDWSLDASPSVGSTGRHQNIFYGLGYSGHGVNLTSLFGRIIADIEAGHAASWTQYPFVNNRLYYVPNEPFRWIAAESELAWYKLTES